MPSTPSQQAKTEPNIFCHSTPGTWGGIHDMKLRISSKSKKAFNEMPLGQGDTSIVAFDTISRKYYALRRYPCWSDSWECGCSAQAQEVESPDSVVVWPPIPWTSDDEEDEN